MLRLIQLVTQSPIKDKIANSITIPIQKIKTQIKNTSTPPQTLDYISQTIQTLNISTTSHPQPPIPEILDMVLTCFNTKLAREICGNVHLNNLLYIVRDSMGMGVRVLEQNREVMERRMGRRELRGVLEQVSKEMSGGNKNKGRRPSIGKK